LRFIQKIEIVDYETNAERAATDRPKKRGAVRPPLVAACRGYMGGTGIPRIGEDPGVYTNLFCRQSKRLVDLFDPPIFFAATTAILTFDTRPWGVPIFLARFRAPLKRICT
jgi:hypothetical protein